MPLADKPNLKFWKLKFWRENFWKEIRISQAESLESCPTFVASEENSSSFTKWYVAGHWKRRSKFLTLGGLIDAEVTGHQ